MSCIALLSLSHSHSYTLCTGHYLEPTQALHRREMLLYMYIPWKWPMGGVHVTHILSKRIFTNFIIVLLYRDPPLSIE